jgi:hypothetical protein
MGPGLALRLEKGAVDMGGGAGVLVRREVLL